MNKLDCFKKELEYIKNDNYRRSAESLIELMPDYFFHVAASSTGKYHPSYSLGDGGLLRHTKAVLKIAKSLFDDSIIGDKYNDREKDLILIGILFHDSIKHGFEESKYTVSDHPLLAARFIEDNKDKTEFKEDDIEFLKSIISSHMGPWNTDYKTGEEILPKPKTKCQNFVHMCDYLGSRKYLEVKFVNGEIEE